MRQALAFIGACIFALSSQLAMAQSSSLDASYRLGAGDRISIKVFGEDDLSMEVLISDSGVINYPFLGELSVKDITIAQLESRIDRGLRGDYLVNPNVNVAITDYRPFFIQGEVEKPGAYPFQPGLTISKAVTIASGFTERAARSKLYIVRADDPKQNERVVAPNDQVRPGDLIVIRESFF